jgi:putative transposase
VKLRDKHVYLPKVGNVKAKLHRLPEENWQLKSGTISQDSDGKYYCSLLFEFEKDIKPIKPQTSIGLDYSSSELYVDCFGNKPDFPKPYRSAQKKFAKEQRRLLHKTKGGKNRAKQKKRVAKVHKKISNQRKNFLHNLSTAIAKRYDIVCIEDLNIKAISRGLRLGKATLDNGWNMFTTMLAYKLAERGKYLSKVDRFFPSSKLCSACNHKKDDLTLSQRTYICNSCGSVLDRDTNAARNILREGVRLVMNHSNYGDSLLCISGLPESWQEATASISGV